MIPGPHDPNQPSKIHLHYRLANDPSTPAEQLKSIAMAAECPILLSYLAANPSTPHTVLQTLADHENHNVRMGIVDNSAAKLEILTKLARDPSPDVRYSVAENHNIPAAILLELTNDDNPYVASRAERTLTRIRAEMGAEFTEISADKEEEQNLITLLIAEDNDFVRSLIRRSLNAHHRIVVVGDCGDGRSAVSEALKLKPNVVLMDIGMPIIDGVKATQMVKEALPDASIIMVTAREEAKYIHNAFEAGADGYFLKTSPLSELAQAVVTVAEGGKWLDPGISSTILRKCVNQISVTGMDPHAGGESVAEKTSLALEILNYEAERLANANKSNEALAVAKAALAVAIAQYGRDSKEAALQLANLAELHYKKEDYRSSESLMLQAIRNREDLLSNADTETDNLIDFLGKMSESAGNRQQAELYYSWSLRIRERLGDQNKVKEARARLASLLEGPDFEGEA